jgi:hypothetical protein
VRIVLKQNHIPGIRKNSAFLSDKSLVQERFVRVEPSRPWAGGISQIYPYSERVAGSFLVNRFRVNDLPKCYRLFPWNGGIKPSPLGKESRKGRLSLGRGTAFRKIGMFLIDRFQHLHGTVLFYELLGQNQRRHRQCGKLLRSFQG